MVKYMLVACSILCAVNAAPAFFAPETLKSGGVNIDVSWYGSPFVYDWDSDGKKDLVCGQFSSGNISFFKNYGTNNNPSFNGYSYLYADGTPITVYAS